MGIQLEKRIFHLFSSAPDSHGFQVSLKLRESDEARKTVCLAGFTDGFNEPADQFELG
jgi:hypothetical protein